MKNIVGIGCGAVFEHCHRKSLEHLAKRLDFRVAGLVDSNRAQLDKAEKWFPEAEGFTDAEACLSKLKDILLTIVASPPPLHAVHADTAFSHGSHVLCEKPLAGSLPDAQRIVEASKRYGRVLSLGMPRRFFPCLVEARRRLLAGGLGEKPTFVYREGGVYGWPIASAAPFRRETSGGGVLLDIGVHALDFLGFLFGPGDVKAAADDGPVASVEANAVTELQFARASGIMQLSWDMSLNNGLHISGSEGEYWVPIGSLNLLFSRDRAHPDWRRERIRVGWPLDLEPQNGRRGCPVHFLQCFDFQLVQTLRAVCLSERPAASGEDGLATMRLISAAYEMATPLNKPWLPEAEQVLCREHHWRTR